MSYVKINFNSMKDDLQLVIIFLLTDISISVNVNHTVMIMTIMTVVNLHQKITCIVISSLMKR